MSFSFVFFIPSNSNTLLFPLCFSLLLIIFSLFLSSFPSSFCFFFLPSFPSSFFLSHSHRHKAIHINRNMIRIHIIHILIHFSIEFNTHKLILTAKPKYQGAKTRIIPSSLSGVIENVSSDENDDELLRLASASLKGLRGRRSPEPEVDVSVRLTKEPSLTAWPMRKKREKKRKEKEREGKERERRRRRRRRRRDQEREEREETRREREGQKRKRRRRNRKEERKKEKEEMTKQKKKKEQRKQKTCQKYWINTEGAHERLQYAKTLTFFAH